MGLGSTFASGGRRAASEVRTFDAAVAADHSDRAERRDSFGASLHALAAFLACACAPISTAPGSLSFVVLLGVCSLRTVLHPELMLPLWRPLLRWPPLLAGAALLLWCSLSLAWSERPEFGWHLLVSMRVLLLPVLIWPVIRRWRPLLAVLLGAITLQAILQIVQFGADRVAWNFDGLARAAGFERDPGKTGLWDGMGACIAAGIALGTRGRVRWLALAVMAICLGGVGASLTRRHMLGLAVAAPAFLVVAAVLHPRTRRPLAFGALGVIVLTAASWPAIGPSVRQRLDQSWQQISLFSTHGGVVHHDLRFYYWRAALDGWRQHPLCGYGLGGTSKVLERSPRRLEFETLLVDSPIQLTPGMWAPDHPHSSWLQLLAETGIVGLALALATVVAIAAALLRRARRAACFTGFLAAWCFWCVAGLFDSSLNASTLSGMALIATFGALPPAQDDRDSEPDEANGARRR